MRSTRFAAVGERLLDAGVAPRHARRAVIEVTDHFHDLVADLVSQGYSRAEAEAEAIARLNPDALVAAAAARTDLHSWVRRWPLVSCTVFPLGMYMAYVAGSIALIVACVTLLDRKLGVTLATSPALQSFAANCLSGIEWAMPIFAAGTFCSIAQTRRVPLAWILIGVALVSLLGATLNAGLLLPPDDRPSLQAGIGFGTNALAQPLFRAVVTLAIVLPIFFWRRAILLGRARKLSSAKLVALVAAIAVHAAMFFLISAPARRSASTMNDRAMTLIVIPPPTDTSVFVSEPTRPATPRPREMPTSPPRMPTIDAGLTTELAPIDFAREAELAAQRGAAAIELERRRARGFTPEAQNREAPIVRTPPPEFGWAKTAQRVEVMPEGGFLIRLSERCVVAVTVVVLPACAFGEIAANGKLFEHVDDPPELGDWKDDSSLPR